MAAPAETPVTIPVLPTDAIAGLLLLHVPPGAASLSVIVDEVQTNEGPVMAVGKAFTVTVDVP